MTTDKCKALLKVIELASLSLAAESLGYTPSGMSRMIAAMEQEAGFQLLIRSRKGVTPTKECKKLLPVIKELSYYGEQYNQLLADIKGIVLGDITIGTSHRTYFPWLTELIAAFYEMHPGIQIHLTSANSTKLLQGMEDHSLDFCIISEREGDFSWIPLQDNPTLAWLPADHPLTSYDHVPLELFIEEVYIDTFPSEDTDNARILKKNQLKPKTKFTTTDDYATYCLVEKGLGVALNNGLSYHNWEGNVVMRPLEPPQSHVLGIAFPLVAVLSPASKAFISFIKEWQYKRPFHEDE